MDNAILFVIFYVIGFSVLYVITLSVLKRKVRMDRFLSDDDRKVIADYHNSK